MSSIPILIANVKAVLNGQRGAYLQPNWSHGRNDSGLFTTYNYEGTYEEILALEAFFEDNNWTWTTTGLAAGRAKLEAHSGFAAIGQFQVIKEEPENIWEMEPSDTEKELLGVNFPNGSINLSSKDSREAVAKILTDDSAKWYPPYISGGGNVTANGIYYIFDSNAPESDNSIVLPEIDYAPAYSLYLLMKAGMTSFPVEASVIKHTQLVSNQYAVKASFINVNRLLSSSSLYSVEGAPSALLFDVPVNPAPSQFIEDPGDLQYAWRKVRPSVTRLAQFKWRIVQNYQFGLWAVNPWGSVI